MKWLADKLKGISLFRGPRRVVAIDFDARCVRLVAAERMGNAARIDRLLRIDLPEDLDAGDPSAVGRFLGESLREHRLGGAAALMNVPRGKAILKPLSLPAGTPDDELPGMVQFQVAKELPFRPEEAAIDFAFETHFDVESAETAPPTRDVLVAAVGVPDIDYYRQIADAARVKLSRLGLRSSANQGCLAACDVPDGAGPVALVHLTAGETEIDVIAEGSLSFSRSAVVHIPDGEQGAAPAALRAAVEDVVKEVLRSLQSYQAVGRGEQFARVLVAGGTGVEGEVVRGLRRRWGEHCELFDPSSALEIEHAPEHASAYIAALGLAIGDCRREVSFDFLHPKRPVRRRDARKVRAAVIAAAAAVAILGSIVAGAVHLRNKRARVESLQVKYNGENPDKVGGLRKEEAEVEALRQRAAALEAWADRGQADAWLTHLRNVSAAFTSCEKAYATSLRAEVSGRGAGRQVVVIDCLTRNKVETTELRKRMHLVGYESGRPGGKAPGRGERNFTDGTRIELIIDPKDDLTPEAVGLAPRPSNDVWARRLSGRAESTPASGTGEGSPAPQAVSSGEYRQVDPGVFHPGSPEVERFRGAAVEFQAYLGSGRDDYFLPHAPKAAYKAVEIIAYVNRSRVTLVAYLSRQSEVYQRFRENSKAFSRRRLVFRGRAWHVSQSWRPSRGGTACPAALIIDTVEAAR